MTSNNKIMGYLDQVTENQISGWAFSSDTETPLSVQLFVNNKKIASILANRFRKDLLKIGYHPTGYCGYLFDLNKIQISLPESCIVQVFVGNTNIELLDSPWFYYNEKFLNEIRKKIRKIHFKENDNKILVVGLAKSGTSILTYRIAAAHPEMKVFFEPHTRQCLNYIALHKDICRQNNIITKAIYYPDYSQYLDIVSSYYNKKVFIIRDPRDILISSFFYSWYKLENSSEEKYTDALKLVFEKEHFPNSIDFKSLLEMGTDVKSSLITSAKKIFDLIDGLGEEWFIVKYEELINNQIASMNSYLGFPVNIKATVPDELERVVRSKSFDNWRRWFTKNDVSCFKPEMEETLRLLGYDADDWELNETDSLPASEGSEYMMKISGSKESC